MLDTLVAADDRDPEALPVLPGTSFFADLRSLDIRSLRIAFTTPLNYAPQVNDEVAAAVRQAAPHFESTGARVVERSEERRVGKECVRPDRSSRRQYV